MLVVVSTPIGNLGDLSPRAAATLRDADVVACEDTRRTGRLLELCGLRAKRLVSLHEHNEAGRAVELVEAMAAGATVALVSDAGTPALSDPGERLIAAALRAGVRVSPVPGPSAALAALVVSGLSADRWSFEGFLPRKGSERRARVAAVAVADAPVVCFEAPGRVAATLRDLSAGCGGERRVVVARELTKLHEEVWRGTLAEACVEVGGREARGEYVLVVDAAPPVAPVDDAGLAAAAGRLRAAGLARHDALVALRALTGAAHRGAYEACLLAYRGEPDPAADADAGTPRP